MYSTVVITGESNLFHLRICRRCLYHSCQNGESASPTQQGHLSAKRRIRENRIGRTSCQRKKELRKVEWEDFSHLSTRSGHKGKNVLTIDQQSTLFFLVSWPIFPLSEKWSDLVDYREFLHQCCYFCLRQKIKIYRNITTPPPPPTTTKFSHDRRCKKCFVWSISSY